MLSNIFFTFFVIAFHFFFQLQLFKLIDHHDGEELSKVNKSIMTLSGVEATDFSNLLKPIFLKEYP